MTDWRKSTFSGETNCVEIHNDSPTVVGIRSSRFPTEPIVVTRAEWDAFVAGVKAGEFDT